MANILGIKTGQNDAKAVEEKVQSFFKSSTNNQIVTPNPEIILKSQDDEKLFYILNNATLSLADGFGLKIAAILSRQKLFRYTGADLLPYLLKEANDNRRRLLIINRKDGLSNKLLLEKYLNISYPNIKFIILELSPQEEVLTEIDSIQAFMPDLAICLFGAPYQEKYIFNLLNKVKSLKVGVGLGGAFDFLTGKIKRAPKLMRQLGLEWLFRLIKQPNRWRRIWRATFVFLTKSIYWIFILPHLYRPNVAILIYKNSEKGREVLIVERQGQENHWQIIQGGRDNLSIKEAGIKELTEETNISDFTIKGLYPNLYRYEFDKELGKYENPFNNRHYGYKGQKQSLLIVEFTGDDSQIKINFWDHSAWKWVPENEFLSVIHQRRQAAGKIYLKKLQEL